MTTLSSAHAASLWSLSVQPESLAKDLIKLLPEEEPSPERQAELMRRVRQSLQAQGYYDAAIVASAEEPGRVSVVAGPQIRFRVVNYQLLGAAAEDVRFRPQEPLLRPGEPLIHANYEAFKQSVTNQATERGYYDARWLVNRVEVDVPAQAADVYLGFDSGQRYRFGTIQFQNPDGTPLTALNPVVAAQLVPFQAGQPITARRVFEAQTQLRDSRYFRDVQVVMDTEARAEGAIPVQVIADASLPSRYSYGAGFSTDVGPRVLAEWQRPLLNPQGHGAEASAEWSLIRQNLTAQYRLPWQHPLQDRLEFSIGIQQERIEDTDTLQTVVSAQRVLAPPRRWQKSWGVRLFEERFERDNGERGAQLFLAPTASLSRLRQVGGNDPVSGNRWSFQAEGASESLLSSASYLQLRAGYRHLMPVGDAFQVMGRLDTGALITDAFDQVPTTLRFFAGGDNSVRGFDFRALSPRDAQGLAVGGQFLVASSLEATWRWRPTWRPAVFVDAGQAFDTFSEARLAVGTGLGIRWVSPVGQIRLDVASAVSEPGAPLRLHLTLGSPL